MKKLNLILVFAIGAMVNIQAQTDSLVLSDQSSMAGEIKTMNRGVITIETDYSDSDFKIEWSHVKEIYTVTNYLLTLGDGSRYNGSLESLKSGKIAIITDDGQRIETDRDNIVFMDDMDEGFWSQVYFSFDVGLDMTKANNFNQLSARSTLGYAAKRWNIDGYYNTLYSSQDEIDDIKRTDAGVGYKYFLPHDWYPLVSVDFLSNTEQQLDLRTTGKVGFGKYVIHSNYAYWGFSLGANYNNENFSIDSVPGRKSWEGFLGTELNLFDIGDLSLLTKLFAYPSFTESDRWRADFNFDAKYEMPFDDDFYIKLGVTYNYDNQPTEGASEVDYILHTGFGWEW